MAYEITKEGLEELKAELKELIEVKRPEVIERLKIARSFGDLSENSEYDAAKDDQAQVESRINELEDLITNAKIIRVSGKADAVRKGQVVQIKDLVKGEIQQVTIVGFSEADALVGKISDLTPLAHAILGLKVGEKTSFETPGGLREVEVVKIGE